MVSGGHRPQYDHCTMKNTVSAQKSPEKRYINDLRRFAFGQEQFLNFKGVLVPVGLAIIFLALVGLVTASSQAQFGEDWLPID